ncbi:MAG: radical SAM protein [Nitrospiraceae bacterium]|nr:radical SAM protein [Nitrospiraceae bacterium]
MNILLIVPPQSGEERYGKLARSGTYLPPLGLAYLAAVLEPRHQVKILDGSVVPVTAEILRAELRSFTPGIVGMSVITPTVYRALELCAVVKEAAPRVLTVLGGPHPTALPEELLENEAVDAVVIGEGEETFRELADLHAAAGNLASCRGIGFRKEGRILITEPRPRITDLDAIPFPARHLLPLDRYRPSVLHYRRLPAFSVMCSRGCPYRCTFCSCAKVFRGKVTLRSPGNVIAEIRMLKERYGAREILLWDDNLGLSRTWTETFCDLIKPLGLAWSAWMRVDSAEPDMLRRMAASGCWHVSYGVESGNQQVLDAIKKGFTLDQVRRAFRWTHEAGMEARGTFVFGLPKETRETMEETIRFAVEIDADYAQFQLLTPYPGTELWDTAKDFGTFDTQDLSKYTIWFPVFIPAGLTKEELERTHRRAYRQFYFRPGYLLKRFSRMRTGEDVKRNLRGLVNLAEYILARKG